MGMPGIAYSFYPLLYNLASPDRPYHGKALKAIGSFSVLAFVICPPNEDGGVRDVIAHHFSFLDIATADRLLFYAPIDEPLEWRRQRETCAVARPLFDFYNAINYSCRSNDPGTTEHSLAVSLGIDLQQLPVIIITTDPRLNEFVALRTSKEHVRRQLLMLAELSQDISPIRDRGEHPRRDYLKLPELRRRGLDLCGDMFTPEMSENLAEALHQVLSLAVVHEHDRGHAYYAGISSRQALGKLRHRIDSARQAMRIAGEPGAGQDEDEQAGKLFRLYEQLATYESLLSSQEALERSTDAEIPEGWDSESVQWMKVGDRVSAALGPTPSAYGFCSGGGDFSPAAVCWSKAFEAELNHSLAHWVREILGIHLPPYYGRFQEGVQAVFASSDGRFRVDFNRRRHAGEDAWKPPELGVLQGPVAYYMKRHPTRPLPVEKWALLSEKWEVIRKIRNDVCHPYPVSRDRARVIRESLRDLADKSVFQSLVSLKARLRGHASTRGESPPLESTRVGWWQFWKRGKQLHDQ